MGAPREYAQSGAQLSHDYNFLKPPESNEDGCPGGWYRCDFVRSLTKYVRLMFENGFSSNVLLDRTEDKLVIEATQYLEQQKLSHRAHCMEVIDGKR